MKTATGRRELVLNTLYEGYHLAEKGRNGGWLSPVETTRCHPDGERLSALISSTDVNAAGRKTEAEPRQRRTLRDANLGKVGKPAQISAENFSLCNVRKLRRAILAGQPPYNSGNDNNHGAADCRPLLHSDKRFWLNFF